MIGNSGGGAEDAVPPLLHPIADIPRISRENIFFAAVEATRMPIVITDPMLPDHPIVFCNPAFQQMTGYSENEVLGRNCRFMQGPKTDPVVVSKLREAIEARIDIAVELINYRKNGEAFWNALFLSPVLDKNGVLRYFFGSQMDVTRRKHVEERANQTERMDALERLIGGVAHDFNNIFQIMRGTVEAIQRDVESPSGALLRRLDIFKQAIYRGVQLTDKMLLSIKSNGLNSKPHIIDHIITDVIRSWKFDRLKEVSISFSGTCSDCCALIDALQAKRAIAAIVQNAIDATPHGGTVYLTTRQLDLREPKEVILGNLNAGRYAVIDIIDQGVGIDKDAVRRAAEPYFSTRPQGQAAGLGLSMANGFLLQSGGGIVLRSELHKGTAVSVYLPLHE